FDRDKESFVWTQPEGDEFGDGAAEMVLELVEVGLQLSAPLDIAAPLFELGLQFVGHARPPISQVPMPGTRAAPNCLCSVGQISARLPTIVAHCRRCSASSVRPAGVIR